MATKRRALAALVATALACTPALPAAAAVHGPGFGRAHLGWGLGRGLFGAAAALVSLPLALAAAAVTAAAA